MPMLMQLRKKIRAKDSAIIRTESHSSEGERRMLAA